MKKKSLAVAAAAASVLALTLQAPAAAAEASPSAYGPGSNPILFVHGWNSSGSTWNTMAERFRADGWPTSHLRQWTYNTGQSNATTAQQLATEVDRLLAATGASKVDVITHSMGGLSSRHYAKNLGGAAKIDAWVSLGGPNHGTDTAYWCFQTSCYEMRPGSSFLNSLNSGDETPGSARYATWWSPCDTVINPDSSVALSGAVNTRTACLSHSGLLSDATVYGQVRDTVDS
ncbi:triacylglycerol lipase [Streptomyces verrucosisporus]|uniref:esterase/lipase family protein n=1 Tax=Streptomyces verrucosisporus TaxID=1695161 RepID=UPI0019D30A5F|nr:triacylglycerol lipase [Streptomyces verrucosisporus]MBN3928923.1 triacylglycerol lipase [Streptomyces verrucosisporus]